MIHFRKVEFRNFLSYGNNLTTYEFEEGAITRIKGENGMGKSSCVVDTIYFALFGRTYRKQKLEQLINWTNKKKLEVTLYFSARGKEYKIERGIRPDYFRIYEGTDPDNLDEDCLIPVSSSTREYQKMLEEDVLHMNEGVFNQTVVKSLTKNISFMTLSKGEKRLVIESILDVEIFTHMNENCKVKLSTVGSEIDTLLERIQNIKTLISAELSNIEQLKAIAENLSAEKDRKLKDIQDEIYELTEKIAKYDLGLTKIAKYKTEKEVINAKIAANTEAITDLRKEKTEVDSSILVRQKKLALFKSTCPECPKIKKMVAEETEGNLEAEANRLGVEIQTLKDSNENLRGQLTKVNEILANEKFLVGGKETATTKIAKLSEELEHLKDSTGAVQIDETRLLEYQRQRNELEKEYDEKNKLKRHLIVMKQLLADEGIKSFIIKRYLPHINKILNTYLQKFNADILFYFDTEFNEIIGSRYKEDASYFCFSEGQKRRIDLAILFTFLEFCKIKNRKSETNLLILDEITAGVDAGGENILYDLLREIVTKEKKEVITVSHSGNIDADKIDRVFNLSVEQGFSKLELVES